MKTDKDIKIDYRGHFPDKLHAISGYIPNMAETKEPYLQLPSHTQDTPATIASTAQETVEEIDRFAHMRSPSKATVEERTLHYLDNAETFHRTVATHNEKHNVDTVLNPEAHLAVANELKSLHSAISDGMSLQDALTSNVANFNAIAEMPAHAPKVTPVPVQEEAPIPAPTPPEKVATTPAANLHDDMAETKNYAAEKGYHLHTLSSNDISLVPVSDQHSKADIAKQTTIDLLLQLTRSQQPQRSSEDMQTIAHELAEGYKVAADLPTTSSRLKAPLEKAADVMNSLAESLGDYSKTTHDIRTITDFTQKMEKAGFSRKPIDSALSLISHNTTIDR